MARATHPLRVALAILAGTVFSPLFFAVAALLVAFLESPGGLPPSVAPEVGGVIVMLLFVWLTGLMFGGPIALAALLALFGPMWWFLHRARAAAATFVGMAAIAGGLAGLLLLLFTAGTAGAEAFKLIPAFLMTGALTGAIMWPIAYAGAARRPDVRAPLRADFTAA
ncbi:MAG: hypothetical protein JWR84_2603 [Caulobacter sp.]|nr:hypothetical protein [Caulobacter sp.]